MSFIEELKWRGMIHDIMPGTEEQFKKEMTSAYIGFDPTADSLHIGSPNTAHTTNPVPCFLLNSKFEKVNDGILADVSPTILKLMGIEKPEEMTGKSLV